MSIKTDTQQTFNIKIHRAAKKRQIPLRVMFELTYRCNFYCRHCYIPFSYRKYPEIKTEEIFLILDQLAELGCFYLGFTGGEPFLRKDIIEILRHAKKRGLEVIIYTNGSLIDENVANELKRLRPNKVDITIPAISKEAFERITGLRGSRDKVFKAVELLYKRKVNLGFKSCVLKENESQIDHIQRFASSLGAFHRLDDMLVCCLNGSEEPYKYRKTLAINPELSLTNKKEPQELNLATERRITKNPKLFKCGVGINQAAITPSGELKMCVQIDYPKYKILESSLNECWQRLIELVDSLKPDEYFKCDSCQLKAYCKWCPGQSWSRTRTFTSCYPESKKRAEAIRRMIQAA